MVAALLVAPVLAACGGPETAGGGAVLEGVPDQVEGATRTAVVPTGSLELTVGTPVSEVAGEDSRDGAAWAAPEGASFLPVHLEFDSSRSPWSGRLAADPHEVDVRLSVAGEERDLGSPYAVRGQALATDPVSTFYVVVPGEPAAGEISLELDYDGATQVVAADGSATGPGAGLADALDRVPTAVPCPASGWQMPDRAQVDVICERIRTTSTPYWPGRGWAPEGTKWQVVQVPRLGAQQVRVGSAVYSVDRVTATVSGEELTGQTYPDSVDGTVVLAEPGPVDVELRVVGSLASGKGQPSVELSLRRELRLPSAPGAG